MLTMMTYARRSLIRREISFPQIPPPLQLIIMPPSSQTDCQKLCGTTFLQSFRPEGWSSAGLPPNETYVPAKSMSLPKRWTNQKIYRLGAVHKVEKRNTAYLPGSLRQLFNQDLNQRPQW